MASSTPSRTRRNRGGKNTEAAPAAQPEAAPAAEATEAPAAEAPKVRATPSATPVVGEVGTPDNPHEKAASLIEAIRKLRSKEQWEYLGSNSTIGEMRLQRNSATVCYVIINKAGDLTARYPQRKTTSFDEGLNLKRVGESGSLTFKQAAEVIVKHNDEWLAEKGSRRSKPATAEAPAAGDGGEGDNLQADLEASVKQATEPQKQTRQRRSGVNPVAKKDSTTPSRSTRRRRRSN